MNNNILVIVESPAKCNKIEKFLGPGYKVLGSFGHITQLNDLKQVDFNNNFKAKYEIIDSKKSQIVKIKKAIETSDEVILATDDDREGEAIAWHICNVFKLDIKKTKRIIFHEITETAIKNAILNPTHINIDLVNAQQARQILDLIVGFKITPLLWKHVVSNTKNPLSAGRCQTPALKLVYDNHLEIEKSPGKIVFTTNGLFTNKIINFTLSDNHDNIEDIERFLELSKKFQHELSKEPLQNTSKIPPLPFTTSSLQQNSNSKLNISPKETMSLAQKLYESGYITYMRTDCKVYSKEFIDKAKQYIINNYNDAYIHPSINSISQKQNKDNAITKPTDKASKKINDKSKKSNNNAQEAHEAIRPTDITTDNLPDNDSNLTSKHRKLYRLIWCNTLESLMAPATYKQLIVKISAPENLHYKYISEENIFPGWKVVQGIETDKYFNYLSTIKSSNIDYKKIISKQSLKQLKNHYTEAKLVQLLEEKGIGRPSTFSSLIEKIQERGYVNKQNIEGKTLECIDYVLEDNKITKDISERIFGNEKNKLVITQIGLLAIEFLTKYFTELFDYKYTENMELQLDVIAKGDKEYYDLCNECNLYIENLLKNTTFSSDSTNKIDKINIKIDDKHTYIIGKNGPTITYIKEDGKMGFYGVKSDIDLTRLRNGLYKIEDIIEVDLSNLGTYKGYDVYLKSGQYGYYLEWNNIKKSLKYLKINVPHKKIQLTDAISILESCESGDNSLVRRINDNLSIRKGKYGDYIFYKTVKMKKPQFLKLNHFDNDYRNCELKYLHDWIKEKYQTI